MLAGVGVGLFATGADAAKMIHVERSLRPASLRPSVKPPWSTPSDAPGAPRADQAPRSVRNQIERVPIAIRYLRHTVIELGVSRALDLGD